MEANGKEKITDILDRRHKERQSKKVEEQIEKKKDEDSTEVLAYFEGVFEEKRRQIQLIIDALNDCQDKVQSFADLQNSIHELQKYLSDSTFFLNDYRIKMCQNTVNDLNRQVETLKNVMIPKKKFGFSNKKATKIKIEKSEEVAAKIEQIKWTFSDKSNEVIMMLADEVNEETITASNLTNCILIIKGHPGSLQISNMKNSLVFCGPVSRSIFLDNCESSKLVVACQQLRCHTSKYCDIYLHVTSRAIIEDCSHILVAKYNFEYEEVNQDFVDSGLNPEINNWEHIDDFNWLSVDKPSPHWAMLDESQLISDWKEAIQQHKMKYQIN